MTDLLTIENLGNLLMLCFLQAVLGFDNLLSSASKANGHLLPNKLLCVVGAS